MAALIEAGPDRARDGVGCWRCVDLQQQIPVRWDVAYHESTVGKPIRRLGFRHISAHPRHFGQDPAEIEAFKKLPRPFGRDRPQACARHADRGVVSGRDAAWSEEQDHPAPFDKLRRARRGTRPRAVADLRTKSAYLFGAICPERGTGAAVVMPHADTEAMQHHLEEIGRIVAPGAQGLIVLDQATWHTTEKLRLPANLPLLPLPPKSPELNPAENVWEFLRQNKLSALIFDSRDAIVAAACDVWNSLIANPDRITSIGTRSWATTGHS